MTENSKRANRVFSSSGSDDDDSLSEYRSRGVPMAVLAFCDPAWCDGPFVALRRPFWPGATLCGLGWLGVVWRGLAWRDMAGPVMGWRNPLLYGVAWRDVALCSVRPYCRVEGPFVIRPDPDFSRRGC